MVYMYAFFLWLFEENKIVPHRKKMFHSQTDKFTYYGHACFMIETNGIKLLFDPFITPNQLASNIDVNTIKPDYILISHGHEDHVADVELIATKSGATIICIWEIHDWLNKKGLTNTHPMNIGGKKQFNFGTVRMTFAAHSSTLPDGSNGGAAAGFIIETPNKTIYYSGDTGLTAEMNLIGKMANINVCILPIGDNFTMDYKDAMLASDMLGCNQIIGVHYDTFGYIVINHQDAINYANSIQKNLKLVDIGSTINL